jgi:predicted transposase YbfD/YdcC
MNEDQDRTRLDNGPHNLAVLRHMALNVMPKAARHVHAGGLG